MAVPPHAFLAICLDMRTSLAEEVLNQHLRTPVKLNLAQTHTLMLK